MGSRHGAGGSSEAIVAGIAKAEPSTCDRAITVRQVIEPGFELCNQAVAVRESNMRARSGGQRSRLFPTFAPDSHFGFAHADGLVAGRSAGAGGGGMAGGVVIDGDGTGKDGCGAVGTGLAGTGGAASDGIAPAGMPMPGCGMI